MAIDRTKKYRCQWQGKNGWANMLEIIPAGEFLNGTDLTVESFSRAAFEMDFAEFGFEDLPIGMMKSQAASFSFIWANLPSGLKELLKNPRYTTAYETAVDEIPLVTTTLFSYYNDEGTGSLILQYVGAQANTMGNTFTYGSGGVYSCQIETFDLLKTIMDVSPPTEIFPAAPSVITPGAATYITPNKVERILDNSFGGYHAKYDIPPQDNYKYLYYSIDQFVAYFGGYLDLQIAYWTRTGLFGSELNVSQTNTPIVSTTFYAPQNNTAYEKGSALATSEVLILGHICEYDGSNYTSVGGFFSNDKDGIKDMFDSMSTFINALCENFVCKLIYKPKTAVNGVTGDTNITYDLYWLKPLQSVGTPVTLTAKITDETYDITTAEKVFLIAESELKNMAGDNINQSRVSVTVSDKTDTWSAQMILHNLPTLAQTTTAAVQSPAISSATGEYGEIKIYPSKLYWKNGEYCQRVHTSVSINDGVNTKTLDTPIVEPSGYNLATMIGWCISMQQTQGLPQAIAEYITTYWSKQDQAMREFPCMMVNAEITPRLIGDLFALGAITDIGVNSSSVLLAGKPDWDNGILDCKFLSLGA